MLGISSSIFNEAGGLVKDWLKNPLNASFFYWYFLPAVTFVLLQVLVIGPVLGYHAPNVFGVQAGATKGTADLLLQILSASLFPLIILPLLIAVLVSSISGTILRFYQGRVPLTRALFQPWITRNQKRSRELYGPLLALRRQYLYLVSRGVRLVTVDGEEKFEPVNEEENAALMMQLRQEIQDVHEQFESTSHSRELPMDVDRVGPNDLANTLAVAEEYPFERYCIDAAVFWPRLSSEIEPAKIESMTASFGAMNGLLIVSLIGFLFALECLVVAAGKLSGLIRPEAPALFHPAWLFLGLPVGVLVGVAAYRAALGTARSVGNAMRTAFDYYRGNVLRRFNLQMPKDLEQERIVWLKLAAFIRRGEPFYYPSEFRSN